MTGTVGGSSSLSLGTILLNQFPKPLTVPIMCIRCRKDDGLEQTLQHKAATLSAYPSASVALLVRVLMCDVAVTAHGPLLHARVARAPARAPRDVAMFDDEIRGALSTMLSPSMPESACVQMMCAAQKPWPSRREC